MLEVALLGLNDLLLVVDRIDVMPDVLILSYKVDMAIVSCHAGLAKGGDWSTAKYRERQKADYDAECSQNTSRVRGRSYPRSLCPYLSLCQTVKGPIA